MTATNHNMEEVDSWENSSWKLLQEVSNSISFSKHGYLKAGCSGLCSIWVLKNLQEDCTALGNLMHCLTILIVKNLFTMNTLSQHTSLVLPSLERTDWFFLPDSFLTALGSLGLLRVITMRYPGSFPFSRLKYCSPQPLLLEHELQNPALMDLHWTHFR